MQREVCECLCLQSLSFFVEQIDTSLNFFNGMLEKFVVDLMMQPFKK